MADPRQEVHIEYTNWRRDKAWRRIRPLRLVYENNEWHPETQWLLEAVDLDKGEERTFALTNIHEWFSFAEIETAKGLLSEKPSISYLQRKMQIGYGRASDIIAFLNRSPQSGDPPDPQIGQR